MIRHIILEGTDNAGKSTLAKALSEILNIPVRGRIVRAEQGQTVAELHVLDVFAQMQPTILDRCYAISDFVYEQVYGGASLLAPHRLAWESDLSAAALVVYVLASEDDLQKRYEAEGDDLQSIDNILHAHALYDQFFKSTTIPAAYVNTSMGVPIEELAAAVAELYNIYRGGILHGKNNDSTTADASHR